MTGDEMEEHVKNVMARAGATRYVKKKESITFYQKTISGEMNIGAIHRGDRDLWCMTIQGQRTKQMRGARSLDEAIEDFSEMFGPGAFCVPHVVVRRAVRAEAYHVFARHVFFCNDIRDITYMIAPFENGFALIDATASGGSQVLCRANVDLRDQIAVEKATQIIAREVTRWT
jgi:hypothetical protein